ncbi:MAG TPA: N-acetylmuramoyl-L-alanine amidase-like domain-containing protein [Lacunisphaera sp.]
MNPLPFSSNDSARRYSLIVMLAAAFAGVLPATETKTTAEKPLYQFTEAEVGAYLGPLQAREPDLRKRIVHLARMEIGQPYELYLLGEMPFETYDPQPLYSIGKSDCLVFAEHMYAMALSHDWREFMQVLQRIRYHDGRIGVATRNHYTEADWNQSNRWLVTEITGEIAAGTAVKFHERIDRSKFLLGRYKLKTSIPVEEHADAYLPYAEIARAASVLRDGDFVNVVRGIIKPGAPVNDTFGGSAWVGHVGLVAHGADGTLHIIHSIEPMVREETMASFIARETAHNAERDATGKARLLGFKFLRLNDDPWTQLRQLDGPDAPHVTLPDGKDVKL